MTICVSQYGHKYTSAAGMYNYMYMLYKLSNLLVHSQLHRDVYIYILHEMLYFST